MSRPSGTPEAAEWLVVERLVCKWGRPIYTLKELGRPVVQRLLKRGLVAVRPIPELHVYIDGATVLGYRVSVTKAGNEFYQDILQSEATIHLEYWR